jgi:hypothetical protein
MRFKLELTATVFTECHLRLQFAQSQRENSDSRMFQCLTPSFTAAPRIIYSAVLAQVKVMLVHS